MRRERGRRKRLFFSKRGRVKFKREGSWRYVRIKESWRAPKGIDSKMRLKLKSRRVLPSIGYRTPKEIRGIHPSGYEEILVHKPEDLEKIDPKTQAVRIAHTVGARKRIKIVEEALRRKIHVLNPRVRKVGIEASKEVGS